ncbi:hypothetical protein POTOM_032642 [Populus tomentosa]|uniref:Uncharacterized protein n=1 Tax=Populus tomentosa TaxID=118781 RepID=A0A8X8CPY6_POPTO|nr:hypothetical protein POTOM_032642 [Populus tomentosa]
MFSELKSFSLMGLSNSEMFFSEKDLNPMEFNFLVRSALELGDDCEIVPQELHQEKEVEEEEKQEDECEISVPTLKIKLPSVEAFQIEDDKDDDDGGFRTPTSLDRKIPVIFQCPPAPRKPKSLPSAKRKSPQRRVLLDLSNEIESLFPPALAGDLGGKIKKGKCVDFPEVNMLHIGCQQGEANPREIYIPQVTEDIRDSEQQLIEDCPGLPFHVLPAFHCLR